MKISEIETYGDLLNCLKKMTKKQLAMKVQITHPSAIEEEVVDCMPGISIGSMSEMGFYSARSCTNNKFVPEEVVILIDYNPFGKDGAIFYELKRNKNNKIIQKPIYGKDGKTKKEDQLNPEFGKYEDKENELSPHQKHMLINRSKKVPDADISKSPRKINKR